MAREVVIIGAGIVGVALARELAARPGIRVTVLDRDRDGDRPLGSTAFAPGFVGIYNDAPILVELARASAAVYAAAGTGFAQAGGLELATSDAGAAQVERRSRAARVAGLASAMLAPAELPTAVAAFVDVRQVVAAARCGDDAVAEPSALTAALRAQAESRGVRFLAGRVIGLDAVGSRLAIATASGARFGADDVVLAGGVWGAFLAELAGGALPLVPVAHPYVYSAKDAGLAAGPFVRWPEHHVYARVHDGRLGWGSYDHRPVPVGLDELEAGAGLPWNAAFDAAIAAAQRLLRPEACFAPGQRVNGVFAMTPDNLPFLGRHPALPGVWVAQAIWITHAAGAAARLADAMTGGCELPRELGVDRFAGRPGDALQAAALRLYRDIYAHEGGGNA